LNHADRVLEAVDGLWSLPSQAELVGGVHDGYRQVTCATHGTITRLDWLLEPFAPVWDAWLSWIEPGGWIAPHRDAGPHRERWQLPISPTGEAFRVEHWAPHAVWNDTPRPRVHLVVDRDVIVSDYPTRFELTDEPAVRLP
jgi:hypothetical protein